MGDSSYMAPDVQSVLDIQKSNTLKENHAGQNGTNIDEHYFSSVQEPELPSSEGGVLCSTKSPPQQNGYHAEMEEEGETESGRLEPQIESEAAQVDMSSLDKNGSISLSSHEAREEDLNGDKARDCNLVPVNSQEGMQEVTMEEKKAQAPANIFHEGPVVNQGHPCSLDSSNVVLMGDTMEDENVVSSNTSNVNTMRGDEDDASSKVIGGNENVEEPYLKEKKNGVGKETERLDVEEPYLKEKKNGVGKETERLDESLTGSATQPCISTESSLENNVQPPLFHSVNESRQHENEVTNKLGEDLEAPSLTSAVNNAIQNEVNLCEAELLDQGYGVTMVISNGMEGWQRFDAEEVDTFTNQTQGSDQGLQHWEKLLDDGFNDGEREILNPPLQLAIAPSPFEENKFGLASPGNPFMEGLERVSSFSEADGFAQSRDLPSFSRLSQSFEEPSSFQWRERQLHSASGNDDISSVLPAIDSETNAVQPEYVNEHGSNLLPSSRKLLTSFDAMEPFEAPSFMSLVDPKSHALFEASMPTYQASSTGYGQENGGEKWVANFDLMAPSTQEITRSSSMPRSGGETSGRRPGQSFSFATSREQEPSKKESDLPQAHGTKSGFLSPKFSPIVQKVVDKVRATPTVANGVLNSVRQAVGPTTSEKKSTSKSLLTCCICW